jgi:hypothetical protein
MRNSVKTLLALIIVAATLAACGEYRRCSPGDRIDITELEEAAKKDDLEATWGEPVKRLETEDGRVDVYSFMSDRGCLLVIWALVPYPIPTDLPTTGHFTVAYGADGSFKQIRVWHNADSPGEAVDLYLQALADEEVRAEEKRHLEMVCEMAFAEAARLTRKAIIDHYLTGCQSDLLFLHTRVMWACLAANEDFPNAQIYMAGFFEDEYRASGLTSDLLEAYKWFGLAYKQGVGIDPDHRGGIMFQLSPSERRHAKQMVTDWKPNPEKCEIISSGKAGLS